MENHTKLLALLTDAVANCPEGDKAVAFSGGLDSSLIASFASRMNQRITLYTAGLPASPDMEHAEATAMELELPLIPIILTEEEVIGAIPKVVRAIGTADPVPVSFELPLYFVAREAGEKIILVGQGADELFGGYARYSKMGEEEAEKRMRGDVKELIESGINRDRNVVALFGKELCCPFLNEKVVEFSLSIPVSEKITENEKKAVLRRAARLAGLGLPTERKKKAAQYGSGIMKVMKKMAKKDEVTVGQWIEDMAD